MGSKLFSSTEINSEAPQFPAEEAKAKRVQAKTILLNSLSRESLQFTIGELAQDEIVKFWTNGSWSMHELVEYVLQQTGPARVFLATWTITENPARSLLNLKNEGLITELKALLDHRIKTRAPQALQLLQGTADAVVFAKCHAKVTTIINEDWGVSIVASSNYSRNPRLEAGTIFTTRVDAIFDELMMQKEMDDTLERTA